ncbi:hypothetical protein [Bacillus sp. AG4(2022)]|uniref:hypothetical protein n=1 Tax=Bacillus sp. AG4(2022) TaxID=2962594 RepID=UPI0028813F6A|nr:hypothetical protein [Bacillus sp. AG4(2022)]MDT0160446.1 hypothetical protein [Bacillus sp. AG4(2022)]
MSNFKVGQQFFTNKSVAISVHEMNGCELNEIIEYPKGEVLEILKKLNDNNYEVDFWCDREILFNDHPIRYEFDEETLKEWVE